MNQARIACRIVRLSELRGFEAGKLAGAGRVTSSSAIRES
jgi:hypothetical protein